MKISFRICLCLLWVVICLMLPAKIYAAENDIPKVDAKEIVSEHLRDSYEWHITNVGTYQVSIPLPIILYSSHSGLHSFMSTHLMPVGKQYQSFMIATEGDYEGKIVEMQPDGTQVRPFDISITKTVLSLIINSILLVALILLTARWYKGKSVDSQSPRGFIGFMEMFIMMIEDDVVKACVGEDYRRYSPYLLTAFFFIFLNNLMGLIPLFPGGGNVTGNIAVTLVLALATFITVNVWGTKTYWKEIFWPEVPMWLKVPLPLMPFIEFVGILTKPFALMIRLFANIMAGHSIILALMCIIFVTASMGVVVNTSMTIVSVLLCVFMNCVEILVAFIQAYVFTLLSAVFIGMSRAKDEHE